MEQTTTGTFAGIDVSQAWLDAWVHPQSLGRRFANTQEGVRALCAWLSQWGGCRVALEATGGLQRRAVAALQAAGMAVAVINPERIWAWRKVMSRKAKNDRLDAQVIAQFAACLQPRALPTRSSALQEVFRRREQLSRILADEKKRASRLGDHPAVRESLRIHLQMLTAQIKQLTLALRQHIHADAFLASRFRLLLSVPGVGTVTAIALLAELPELGQLAAKPIAALAGLAPYVRESGAWRGQSRLLGGRPLVRAKLFMAAVTAVRCNPVLKAYCQHLLQRGKHWKVAITACMRKLLTILNAIAAKNTPWINS